MSSLSCGICSLINQSPYSQGRQLRFFSELIISKISEEIVTVLVTIGAMERKNDNLPLYGCVNKLGSWDQVRSSVASDGY